MDIHDVIFFLGKRKEKLTNNKETTGTDLLPWCRKETHERNHSSQQSSEPNNLFYFNFSTDKN